MGKQGKLLEMRGGNAEEVIVGEVMGGKKWGVRRNMKGRNRGSEKRASRRVWLAREGVVMAVEER